MSKLTILQGEDCDCQITMKDINGTVIDLSGAGVKVYAVLMDGYRTIFGKFKSGSTASGWELIDNTNFLTGVLSFSVLSTVTKTMAAGDYYLEVLMRFPSSTHGDGYYDVQERVLLFSVMDSILNKISSLP